jgi:hypothetical protein
LVAHYTGSANIGGRSRAAGQDCCVAKDGDGAGDDGAGDDGPVLLCEVEDKQNDIAQPIAVREGLPVLTLNKKIRRCDSTRGRAP